MESAQKILSREEHDSIVAPLQDKIDHQTFLIEKLQHALYGRKSERAVVTESGEVQGTLFPENLSAPAKEEHETVQAHRRRKPRKPRFPEDALRKIIDLELSESERVSDCGKLMKDIGYESSEQAHIIPAQMVVLERRRHKYGCPCGKCGVRIAPLPASAFPKAQITAETRAHFLVQKFVDHVPYYRQSKILARNGVDIPDSSMSRYGLQSADALAPVVWAMREEVVAANYLQADETTLRVLGTSRASPGAHLGYVWAYGIPRSTIVFEYQNGRGAKHPEAFLELFEGVVQTDRYGGYNGVRRRDSIIDVGCWAHARRKFIEAQKYASKRTKPILKEIGRLYAIERRAREAGMNGADRGSLRVQEARPILVSLHSLLEAESARALPSSPLGEAIRYSLSNWPAMVEYVEHGQVEIDNNLIENAIRPIALGRKNYLFAGSEGGAEAAATIYSITESCRRLCINPYVFLCELFERLATVTDLEEYRALTPARWAAERTSPPCGS